MSRFTVGYERIVPIKKKNLKERQRKTQRKRQAERLLPANAWNR